MQKENNILSARLSLIRQKFSDFKIDGLIFFNLNNIRYLSGFTGSDGVLVVGEHKTLLLVDGRYTTQARREVAEAVIIEYKDKNKGIIAAVRELDLKYIGFEAGSIVVQTYNQLVRELRKEVLVPLGNELKLLRAHKSETEIALMKKAADISAKSIAALIPEIKAGFSEKDIALQLEMIARKSGADQLAFETIVAFGENSALPHAKPTNRKIRRGDFIVLDFGVKYHGYCSDETCTFVFQQLTDEQKNAYQLVKKAHDQAIAAVRAGVAAAEIDRCARNIFGEKYEKYFTHGTGHGVGLEVHEAPRLAADSPDVLEAQMVLTVEPGLYFPGRWGIRIEDTVLVKKNGCEKFTKMDKELIIIQ
ncbi:MAG: integrase [Deltaproteobacteria bacterium HGW-Deltaproteobacteria-12]|jgi:Xaa-Pro aminopeptidase/Xaa-Pro dipeptidase|nr:MAG: integrase [Deltaproteobacteria bacterium HGW-Deltaproteobacteria-12]